MTGRCYDWDGPREPGIATSEGLVPITRETAARLAVEGMLLAYSPEHRELLRRETAAAVAAAG